MSMDGFPSIFVKGLPQECSKAQIRNCFSEYGKVQDILYKYGADANRVKGIAFVHFESQETVDKLIEEKFVTMNDHKLEIRKPKDLDGKNKEEQRTDIPQEALKCHICKKGKFLTVRTFYNHIHGKLHQVLAKMYRAKTASVIQLLKAESKLASDRLYDMKWVKENPSEDRPYCDVCQVQINYNPIKHEKSAEHKMVVSYVNKKCCDIEFFDRFKYENHLLSLTHLKNAYEKEQQRKLEKSEERLTMKKAIDIYKQCDQDLKELKEKYVDLDLNEELPPFDNQPIGLNHIVKKINYYCICCDQKFFANINFVKPHCRSYNHYSNMVDFITEIEKENQKRISDRKEKKSGKPKEIEDIEIKKRERDNEKEDSGESAPKKLKTSDKDGESKKDDDDGNEEEEEDAKDHHDEDYEMHEVEDAENEEEEEEEEGYGHGDSEEEQEEEHEEEHEEEQEEEHEEEHEEEQEENEEHEEDHDEEQEQEMEEEEESVQKDEEAQEEVVDLENQPEEDDEVQVLEQEETEATETPQEEENSGDVPVEETKEEEEEEEEEVVEIPKRKATRGRRGRGRGRGLRR